RSRFSFPYTATPALYPLSLHDALPIFLVDHREGDQPRPDVAEVHAGVLAAGLHDRLLKRVPLGAGESADIEGTAPFRHLDQLPGKIVGLQNGLAVQQFGLCHAVTLSP